VIERIYNYEFVGSLYKYVNRNRVGSRFTTGLRSRIVGCKSNRRKTSII